MKAYGIDSFKVQDHSTKEYLRNLPREEIKELYLQGFSHKEIACKLNVNPRSVSRVIKEFGIGKKNVVDYSSLNLSDVLSVIETRDFVGATIQSDPLVSDTYYGSDLAAAGRYGTVRLPENLYIVGTVNMDETTFPFSRKVLDRANTIEFSYVDLIPNFDELPLVVPQAMNLSNAFLKTEYLLLGQCVSESEAVNSY